MAKETKARLLTHIRSQNPKPRLQDYGHDDLLECASTKGMWSAVVALLGKPALHAAREDQPGNRCYNT